MVEEPPSLVLRYLNNNLFNILNIIRLKKADIKFITYNIFIILNILYK